MINVGASASVDMKLAEGSMVCPEVGNEMMCMDFKTVLLMKRGHRCQKLLQTPQFSTNEAVLSHSLSPAVTLTCCVQRFSNKFS